MKNILHKLCLKLHLYREIYNGHFNIGKTLAGTYFIYGDYALLTLKRCIELERGYHQESYMQMKHDVQKSAPSKSLIGVGLLGAALAAGCDEVIRKEQITPQTPSTQRFDPPHS